MGQQETAIYEVLRKAQADGTLSQTQDARALARFFLGVAWGINAVNKSVADPGVFRDMVRVAMSVPRRERFYGGPGCRIPAKCALFTQLMRESQKPEDSLADDAV